MPPRIRKIHPVASLRRKDDAELLSFQELQKTYRHHDHIRATTEEYVRLHTDKSVHPRKKIFHRIGQVLKFAVRLFIPDFLVGHPNLWDNLKALFQHRSFRPLRVALAMWLIFTMLVGSSGVYSLVHSKPAEASGTFSMKTGYYEGNGTTLSVTGLGFQPEMVIIKSDNAAGALIWKTSAMPTAVTSYLGLASADTAESEVLLNADGFTVSPALEVNTVYVRYLYIAYAGSDCTSGGVMCIGSYTGDGAVDKVVSTGFQPNLAWVKRTTAVTAAFRTTSMADNTAALFTNVANDATGTYFETMNATGFTVGTTNNGLGGIHYYAAFKNLAGKMFVGTFTGDGTDNREITGVGFEPDFVLVKQNAAVQPALNTTESWGDSSSFTAATAVAVNSIQELKADGFQVGSSTNVNANAVGSFYFAMGGAADPASSGSFYMQKGSYTGTGAALTISTPFRPDLVIIKADAAQHGVFALSMEFDHTHYLASATQAFSGGVTSMDATSFTLGTSATTNGAGSTYEYTIYGNATTPQRGAGAADFSIGLMTGNGISARAVDHAGIAPSMLVMQRSNGTAQLTVWKTSAPTMAANTNAYFSATADTTDGTVLQDLTSDGFKVGTAVTSNTANTLYAWFAFKEGSYFDVGTYTGTGVSGRNVTGLGFDPTYVMVKRDTAVQGVHRSTSSTITGQNAQFFTNVANATNEIIAFVSDGFQVGTAAEANANTGAYRYAAWKTSTSANPPSTPTNSSPANAATAQSLNVALSASAYSDPEGNTHTNTQWQVDESSTFDTPDWTRTSGAAETSTSVTSGNGTFANTLAGKTELNHNTTYYWRVRYFDSEWSSWSTGTTFTTNTIQTPTNSSPADAATVTTLTPTLSANAFSDAQGGHTSQSAQWQISTSSSFTSPYYDSGTVSYGASFAVPSAVLADKTVYYWHVRYADSSGQWSSYSTATRFLTSQSVVVVYPLFSNSVVDQGNSVNIDAQIKLTDGSAVNTGTATVSIYNPAGTKIVNAASMTYLTGTNGVYRYVYTVPAANGSYLYEVSVTSSSGNGTGAANFEVRTISQDITALSSAVAAHEAADAAERAAQAVERAAQAISRAVVVSIQSDIDDLLTEIGTGNISAIRTATDTIDWGDVTGIVTDTGAIKLATDTIDWGDVTAIRTATDTIDWADVTGIDAKVSALQASMATLITEIGSGNISAIRTATDTIDWSDVSEILTDTGAIRTTTDTIDWSQVAAIKTSTDTIAWGDVTAIKLKTDTIVWGDITTIKGNVATLITQIGVGNIAAIKTATDTIAWGDITTIVASTNAIQAKTDDIDWSQVTAIQTATDTIDWDDVTGIKVKTDTIAWGDVTAIADQVANVQDNIDVLVGAMVVTQSTVDDAAATPTSFVTALTNGTDDFYKNAVLTFTSGSLDGQVRRIASYDGTSKVVTVSPALAFAPGDGDAFTIAKQNVYVEEALADHEAADATFRTDTTSRLASIEDKVDTLTTMVNTVDTNLDAIQGTVNDVRASQLLTYDVTLSDVTEIQAEQTYRAKLTILNFESEPANPSSPPTVTLYDSTRQVMVAAAAMTQLSVGVYEYTYVVPADATSGLWETVASVDAGGANDIIRNDYWTVSGSPAQVLISSMSSVTVPNIAANVVITNEGTEEFEYQYEWCVVVQQDNDCGGGDDVYYGSAAKLIQAGDSFNTVLTATVPTPGPYWFKVRAFFGSQASGASRTFTALSAGETPPDTSGNGGSSGSPSPTGSLATHENIYAEIIAARQDLEANSRSLSSVLSTLGMMSPKLDTLLSVQAENTEDLKDVQNKLADLRAVTSTTRQLLEGSSVQPIIETYMKFNSVEIHFLITNPADTQQTVHFKALLPAEATPESIIELSGLELNYDATAGAYEVSGEVTLAAHETAMKKVEMKDIWVFTDDEIAAVRSEVETLVPALAGTQYAAQATLLRNDILTALTEISTSQKASYSSPQEHIVTYRNNVEKMKQVQEDVGQLKDLVVQAGVSQSLVGKIGGIQTFTTWGIIVALIFGFGLLAAVIFSMWRHQTMLAAMSLGMSQQEALKLIGGKRPPAPRRPVRVASRPLKMSPKAATVVVEDAHKEVQQRLAFRAVLGACVAVATVALVAFVANKVIPSPSSLKAPLTNEESAVSPESAAPEPAEAAVAAPLVPSVRILETPTGWLNVRAEPALDGAIVTRVKPGEEYPYAETREGWYRIVLSDGSTGWIIGTYAAPVTQE